MERAKTFFGNRDHEGYVGKEDHLVSFNKRKKWQNNLASENNLTSQLANSQADTAFFRDFFRD